MSRVFLHKENSKNKLLKQILLLLIPFMLYGFYKNGIALRSFGLFYTLKPMILTMLALIASFIFSKLKKSNFISYNLLANFLFSLIIMPNINILSFVIFLLILNIINFFTKLNPVSITMILTITVSFILKKYTFLNVLESQNVYKFSLIDYLIGKGYGGISNTALLFSFISLVILGLNREYKVNIPIYAFIFYYVPVFIYALITNCFSYNLLLNNNLIFAYIFIAPISIYSSYSKGGSIIYGSALGLLTFVFSFMDINLGIYISLSIVNLLHYLFDKVIVGKTNYIEVL